MRKAVSTLLAWLITVIALVTNAVLYVNGTSSITGNVGWIALNPFTWLGVIGANYLWRQRRRNAKGESP